MPIQRIRLSKLPQNVTEEHIKTWIKRFGEADNIYIARKAIETYAFLDFNGSEDACVNAIKTINKIMLSSCKLVAEYADAPKINKYQAQIHLLQKQRAQQKGSVTIDRTKIELREIKETAEKLRKLHDICEERLKNEKLKQEKLALKEEKRKAWEAAKQKEKKQKLEKEQKPVAAINPSLAFFAVKAKEKK